MGRMGGWQSWAGRNQLLLCNFLVCYTNKTVFTMNENTTVSGPLTDIFVPEDQHVTLGQLSTPNAFRVEGNQLFLTVTPDYEVQTVDRIEYAFMGTQMGIHSPNLGKIQGKRD